MPLNHEIVGVPGEPGERSWTSTDVMLYALAVGAGQADPLSELEFTTENSIGISTKVLPTFANMIGRGSRGRSLGNFNPAALLHGEQAFSVNGPLPVEGTARTVSKVTGIYDKGSGALVTTEAVSVDATTGTQLATTRSSVFIRGEGGFGGERGPSGADWDMPTRAPDLTVNYGTRPEQALVYRLTGDRNPLHSDPQFAAKGGLSRPILHGMCTYGYTGRALLHAVCGSDPARFHSMEGRFTKPVTPGDELTIVIWVDGTTAYFQTTSNGVTVLDRGRLTFSAAG
jgi:acyl dehydratase